MYERCLSLPPFFDLSTHTGPVCVISCMNEDCLFKMAEPQCAGLTKIRGRERISLRRWIIISFFFWWCFINSQGAFFVGGKGRKEESHDAFHLAGDGTGTGLAGGNPFAPPRQHT